MQPSKKNQQVAHFHMTPSSLYFNIETKVVWLNGIFPTWFCVWRLNVQISSN